MRNKLFAVVTVLVITLAMAVPSMAENDEEITVYYTNDIHSYIDNAIDDETGLTYSKVAALKVSTPGALLVDAGDHIQGTAYGDMDSGETIIDLMNATGYDAATLGNHEFDYGMEGCMAIIEAAEYPYISSNFRYEKNGVKGDLFLDSYVMLESGGKNIAFVGITTPETITASFPSYFQDNAGNYIYGIDTGADGKELYTAVQTAIDEAEADGADYIIALGHLGVDLSSGPWTSRNVIANVAGLDAFIDGHSHTTLEMEKVTDKNGDIVILTQTGSYMDTVGKLTISAGGVVSTTLLTGEELVDIIPDAEVKKLEDDWINEVNGKLGEVIGYSQVVLDNYDREGNRLVRRQSTNTGDFAADALYYLFDEMDMDVDVAVMNGGGIRNGAVTGDMSYLTCKEIHTFGNVACLLEVTGQQILDALEWGSKGISADGLSENGSLLHVSGLKYTLDLSYESSVQADDKDVWTGPPTGEYRVKNVQVWNRDTMKYEPLDLSKTYRLAGYNYTLRDLGGGFAMLNGSVNVLDYVAEDYMVLANYIKSFPVGKETGLPTITADSGYVDVNGSGRITILTEQETAAARAEVLYDLWELAGKPKASCQMHFTDVSKDAWYAESISWAASEGIITGYSSNEFGPDDAITREQLVTIMWRYAKYNGDDVSVGEDTNILSYDDAVYVSEWAVPAMQWACGLGIIRGIPYGNTMILQPAGCVTQTQAETVLQRFCENAE
ncbi:MAG: 5'-nucleotidase C-terminal domain-containing protein [Firmicutes bacterium]|nr:5'-nucleotidase C-terminal domain-containing protein [Bacillota bacterium]